MQKLKFATWNINKMKEAREVLHDYEIEQIDVDLDELQTIEIENLIEHKAIQAYSIVWEPVMVEDTWLFLKGWNMLPWALIKWFMVSVWPVWILNMLSKFEDRRAIAKCVVAMYDWNELKMWIWEVEWTISDTIRWESWFGWDVIFIPDWYDKTFAELWQDIKNTISHRRIAFRTFAEKL